LEKKNSKSINRIKQVAKENGASSRLISLWVDVDYTTVSNWSSNKYQPSDEKLNQIGELLQKDTRDLLEPQGRMDTGLAAALEKELKRLNKEQEIPYEIEKFDKKKGVIVKVNNPELIRRLKEFASKHDSINANR
jgi:DNA-binding XRE family transcriptional regulator